MMRHLNDEERELMRKLHNESLSEEEKSKIKERLRQIDDEEFKDCPFVH